MRERERESWRDDEEDESMFYSVELQPEV